MNRESLKKIVPLKSIVITLRALKNRYSFFTKVALMNNFFSDYKKYKSLDNNKNFYLGRENLFPRIYDKTGTTSLDPVYFYQDTWCAKKIFTEKPSRHYDIASQAHLVGIISQFTPTTMVDIRPLSLSLQGLSFIKGDITNLPFKDNAIESLSSICVIEHIGLGRYGDALDAYGSEKATKELKRVLAVNGNLYVSVPIDSKNKIYFNAHRSFTRSYILQLFEGLLVKEEKYIYGNDMQDMYDSAKGFGTGLYHFQKLK